MGSGVAWNYTLEASWREYYTHTLQIWCKVIISFFYIELRQKVCISLLIEKARIKEYKGEDSFAYNKYMLIMLYYFFNHILYVLREFLFGVANIRPIWKGVCAHAHTHMRSLVHKVSTGIDVNFLICAIER